MRQSQLLAGSGLLESQGLERWGCCSCSHHTPNLATQRKNSPGSGAGQLREAGTAGRPAWLEAGAQTLRVWLGSMPHSSFLKPCLPLYLFLPIGMAEEAEKFPSGLCSSPRASSRSGGRHWKPAISARGGQGAGSKQVCVQVRGQMPAPYNCELPLVAARGLRRGQAEAGPRHTGPLWGRGATISQRCHSCPSLHLDSCLA